MASSREPHEACARIPQRSVMKRMALPSSTKLGEPLVYPLLVRLTISPLPCALTRPISEYGSCLFPINSNVNHLPSGDHAQSNPPPVLYQVEPSVIRRTFLVSRLSTIRRLRSSMKANSLPSGENCGCERSTVVEGNSTSSFIKVAFGKFGSSSRTILAR